jgi:hypothetical protein
MERQDGRRAVPRHRIGDGAVGEGEEGLAEEVHGGT